MNIELFGEIIGFLLSIGIGMGCGSYSTSMYYRSATGEPWGGKWTGDKSYCPTCKATLRTRDMIPMFNWLITGGKCHFCGVKINPVYFFVEFSVTILSVLIFLRFGFENTNLYMIYLCYAMCLVVITATDFSYHKIANSVLAVMTSVAFLYHSPEDIFDMVYVLVIAVMISVLYTKIHQRITGRELKRYDYLKFICVTALFFNYIQFFTFILLSACLAIFIPVLGKIFQWEKPLPFTGSLSLSTIVVMLL